MLNWNHLRLFAAAARCGSVSAAAASLRLSQPAVSKQIAELESSLGVTLLERTARGVRPTPAGELLAGYAQRLFALAEEAERSLGEMQNLRRGRLRIGASMTIGVYLAPPLLAQFRRQCPELEIEFLIGNTDTVQKKLVDRELDIGLTEGPGQWESDLTSDTFHWDELVVIADPSAPASMPVATLARQVWVMREPGSGTRAVAEEALATLGLHPRPAWIFNNPEAVKRAVMAGCGVAMVPRITIEAEIAAHTLRVVKVPGLARRRPLRLQRPRTRPASAAMTAFSAICHNS